MRHLLVAQSGGPTAAINATLVGIVERAQTSDKVDRIYGALYGIEGVLRDNLVEIGDRLTDSNLLNRLLHTPSAALGSCRYKLGTAEDCPEAYQAIFSLFKQYDIGWFIYIGGNDSMDTVQKLAAYAEQIGSDVRIMGAPKTIDNDLHGMDHSPGFGSAARYIATTFSELWCDCKSYGIPTVTIVEVMGRHVGWLTASSVLATGAPHLMYLPEIPFDTATFLQDLREKQATCPAVVIAVSEGIRYADGSLVSETKHPSSIDAFGHKYLSGAGKVLADIVREEIGCKVRSVEFSLMQRSAAHLASPCDLTESRLLGATALDRAIDGISGQVAVIKRISDEPYRVVYDTVPASTIANKERAIPRDWINKEGNFVGEEMVRYLTPLVSGDFAGESVGGLPVYLYFY